MNKEKIQIKEFLKENKEEITIIGIFLAILSFSFEFIHKINSSYAGYIALAICLISFLFLINLFKENEKLSPESLIFLGALTIIVLFIFLTIKEYYKNEYIEIIKLSLDLIAFFGGAIISVKVYLKNKKRVWYKITLILLTLLLILIPEKILEFYFEILIKINLNVNILFNHYLIIFSQGIILVFVMIIIEDLIELIKILIKKFHFFRKKS